MLAYWNTDEEYKALASLVMTARAGNAFVGYVQSLGAREPSDEWGWVYMAGSAPKDVPWDKSKSEPNQFLSLNEDCAVLSQFSGKLEDDRCTADPNVSRTVACRSVQDCVWKWTTTHALHEC